MGSLFCQSVIKNLWDIYAPASALSQKRSSSYLSYKWGVAQFSAIIKLRNRHRNRSIRDYRIIVLGACHSYGMMMTNRRMAETTASLTHLVKMSEPFYTTTIMATMGNINFNCMIIFTMMIILIKGAGLEPISDNFLRIAILGTHVDLLIHPWI